MSDASGSLIAQLLALAPQRGYGSPGWVERVNATVAARFSAFAGRLMLTERQQRDAQTKVEGIARALNREYWNTNTTDHVVIVGSWGKGTACRPPRDVDLLFVLPDADFMRFQGYQGNKQSQLLQEVKGIVEATYASTRIRGDGQVVVIDFAQDHGVEVLPAFTARNGQFLICDTKDGGRYKLIDPVAEMNFVQASDIATSGVTRDVIRMVKRWQQWCNVDDLKSFAIEFLVIEFFRQNPGMARPTRSLYDYVLRDLFGFIVGFSNAVIVIPGTGARVAIGDAWVSKAQTAYDRAAKASAYEVDEFYALAAQEWQQIFGTDIA